MPTYEYKCRDCSEFTTKINRIANRKNKTPECRCGGSTDFRISTPNISGASQFQAYPCPNSGELVTSRKTRAEIMKKHNLRESEPLT